MMEGNTHKCTHRFTITGATVLSFKAKYCGSPKCLTLSHAEIVNIVCSHVNVAYAHNVFLNKYIIAQGKIHNKCLSEKQ